MESNRRTDLLAHADPAVREAALKLADEITRPLTVPEIEAELVRYYTRGKAREIVTALKFFDVVVLRADPAEPTKYERGRCFQRA